MRLEVRAGTILGALYLGLSLILTTGCLSAETSEDIEESEPVGTDEQLWSSDWPARGWVDSVLPDVQPGPLPPNLPPNRILIQGWACLGPQFYFGGYPWPWYPNRLRVYQATKDIYSANPLPFWSKMAVQRMDNVNAGRCGDPNNGFNLVVIADPNKPQVFNVFYDNGYMGAYFLEGKTTL